MVTFTWYGKPQTCILVGVPGKAAPALGELALVSGDTMNRFIDDTFKEGGSIPVFLKDLQNLMGGHTDNFQYYPASSVRLVIQPASDPVGLDPDSIGDILLKSRERGNWRIEVGRGFVRVWETLTLKEHRFHTTEEVLAWLNGEVN